MTRYSRSPRRAMSAFQFDMAMRDMRREKPASQKAWKRRVKQNDEAAAEADKRRLSLSKKGW